MYKVFFNQKPLILTNEIQDFSDNEPLLFIKYTSVAQIIKALKSFDIASENEIKTVLKDKSNNEVL